MNRGNERQTVFHTDNEYASFLQLVGQAGQRTNMRTLAFCLMSNHFHLCLWPREDGDLSRFMQWLTTKHVAQYRKSYPGSGHVWQGRFKSFAIQDDEHLWTVLKYIERNPVRAGLAPRAPMWPWSSAGLSTEFLGQQGLPLLHPWPRPRPANWLDLLLVPEGEVELERIRKSVANGSAYGDSGWTRGLDD